MTKPTTSMTKPTIMLADDDEVYLNDAKTYLEDEYRVVTATTTAEARRLLETTPMAVAFIDIVFNEDDNRDKSGLTLAMETIDTCSVPKVIITGHQHAAFAREALKRRPDGKSAAVDILFKPDGLEELKKSIEQNIYRARVFLSYARTDKKAVNQLYDHLSAAGFIPWLDTKGIHVGKRWPDTIKRAIEGSDFFILCLSRNSVRRRGFLREEIETAVGVWNRMLRDDIFFIPVRLEECECGDDRLRELQWVDLFDETGFRIDSDGFQRLVDALRTGVIERM